MRGTIILGILLGLLLVAFMTCARPTFKPSPRVGEDWRDTTEAYRLGEPVSPPDSMYVDTLGLR